MEKEEFLEKTQLNQLTFYSNEINGLNMSNSEFLRILINKFRRLDYENLLDHNQTSLDFRFQLFIRCEIAVMNYYQSILSNIRDFKNIWNDTEELGYRNRAIYSSIMFREVSCRTTFLEKTFYCIDYFIHQLNQKLNFNTNGSIHNKQQLFKMAMEALEIDQRIIKLHQIIEELNEISDEIFNKKIFKKGRNRTIHLHEFYTYLVAIRNILHSNGYASRNLNKLDIGGVILEIKKSIQIDVSHSVIVIATYLMLYPINEIVKATVIKYPNQFWEDGYTIEFGELLDEAMNKKKEAS